LLKSSEAKLLSIRRITQDNQSKIIPGADGITLLTTNERLKLGKKKIILDGRSSKLRKVEVLKKDGTVQYLTIPTIYDRIRQYLFLLAVEPE
jgi:retron-type reverse transcriptase